MRNDLDHISVGELAIRRDEILEALGERAKVSPGINQHTKKEVGAESAPTLKTTKDIAKEIGVTERVLQQNKQLARSLTPEVKETVRKHDLPKTEALLRLFSSLPNPPEIGPLEALCGLLLRVL